MARKLHEGRTVVITGASTGLGRAAALEFAREGANLGLVARDEVALRELAEQVRALGVEALVLPLDVTNADAVDAAARAAHRTFGSIDVWINNAAIAVYGDADEVPLDEMRRIMDVNFFGQVHGIRAALPYLEKADGTPCLFGVLSVLSEAATPQQATYTASKHALAGFYACLHEELIHRKSRVRVGTLLAPSMATPLFDHAKTYTGRRPKPLAPVYPPERFARVIVEEAVDPHFRIVRGSFAHFALFAFRRVPSLAHEFQGRTGYRAQRTRVPKGPNDGDNLRAPMVGRFGVRGSTEASRLVGPLEALFRPSRVALAAVALGGVAALRRRRARRLARPRGPWLGEPARESHAVQPW